MIEWSKVLENTIKFNTYTKVLPTKGNLVYEYNPLRNYRINQNMYEYKGEIFSLGDLWNLYGISIKCKAVRTKSDTESVYTYQISENETEDISTTKTTEGGIIETTNDPEVFGEWIKEAYSENHNADRLNLEKALKIANVREWYNADGEEPYLRESGELVDFITDELSLSIEHPVNIVTQPSYDGSVNLIINDGVNTPRLINTRFSSTGKNTYEVVDRKGNNDTNIYDQGSQFDVDTSLYKRVTKIPKIQFNGVLSGGDLKVGNYFFYFKLADADGNETDFVGESGLVSVFIGFDACGSATTGQKNENSYKQVSFKLSNIDPSYDYVHVYYSRTTAEDEDNFSTQYARINKEFLVNKGSISNIVITGYESITEVSPQDINLSYNVVDSAVTATTCQNMLFLANVHKPNIQYKELADLSLRFLPYLKEEKYDVDIDQNYTISSVNAGYVDPLYIYNKTGYWGEELYRFGIVYILPNGELSPVFNIRGGKNISIYKKDSTQYTKEPLYITEEGVTIRNYISYNEETFILENGNSLENIKGVVSFLPTTDVNTVYSVDIRVDDETIQELKKYVKGYFFVRQTRIPNIIAQGITLGIDPESRTPTIPTRYGFLDDLSSTLTSTYVETDDINGTNYISEGFLKRYTFRFKKKSSISLITGLAIAVGVCALAAAVVFTAGAAGAAAGAVTVSGSTAAAGTAATTAAATGAAAAIGAAAGAAAGATAGATIASTVSAALAGGVSALTGLGTAAAVAGAGAVVGTGVVITAANIANNALAAINSSKKRLNGRETKVPAGYKIVETDESRTLTQEFVDRVIIKDSSEISAILCPDYELNQAKYNQIFTGNKHIVKLTKAQNINGDYFTNEERHFYVPAYKDIDTQTEDIVKIIPVPDNVKCVGIDEKIFRSRAGEAEEAWRYECVGEDYKSDNTRATNTEDSETLSNKQINTDIIRGSFGPYLAFINGDFKAAQTVNIYSPGYSNSDLDKQFYVRMIDNSVFSAITDRYDINDADDYLVNPLSCIVNNEDRSGGYTYNAYRGDCYICQFTHRVIRNFNDPSAPYNDEIVDEDTWKDNYDPENTEKYEKINLGDVNAIQLGMWVTFTVRSSSNLNIRTIDGSQVDEAAMCGHPRAYYPYHPMSVEGTYKIPESKVYNKGFNKSVSDKWNFEMQDVPYLKNWYGTRIMYSDIHINDAFKNGYRVFQGTNYRDYTREYGEIVKLLTLNSYLVCVFEHGVALLSVNTGVIQHNVSSDAPYINPYKVLPETPTILSDTYGSQWQDSVIKTPKYIYGIDTVARKIWRTNGSSFECISDKKVQEFLNNNISLSERELSPKIGIRNVKTMYNAFKHDVLFTFYDNTYGFEEKVWNLCWNEDIQVFTTFYSWVPSFMENIDNIPFSFDRNTSKWIAKLGTSHSESSFADGITLTNVIVDDVDYKIQVPYTTKTGEEKIATFTVAESCRNKYIGTLLLKNRVLPSSQLPYVITYSLQRDQYGNYKKFEIKPLTCEEQMEGSEVKLPEDATQGSMQLYYLKFADDKSEWQRIYYKDADGSQLVLDGTTDGFYTYVAVNNVDALKAEMYYRNKEGHSYADFDTNRIKVGDVIDGKVSTVTDMESYPIFKNVAGKRPTLDRTDMVNADKLVTLLNIRATIKLDTGKDTIDNMYYSDLNAKYGTSLIDAGYYESVVAVTPKWNLQFMTSDFWKHGQAGIIDIADDIYPTYWYGKQHPFEFECIVVEDPSVHKIFTNLEIISNKAKPESFHYEVVGEVYDFAPDKVNMYFRQEALKALWQYNGADITYNRNFLKTQPRQQAKSADLPHRYYTRQDTINDVEDYYIHVTYPSNMDYSHLSGAEIVYYPNMQEYRVWNHVKAVDVNDLSSEDSRSVIAANCQYLEDRWKVTINPILVCYKNEYQRKYQGALCVPRNSTWVEAKNSSQLLPPLPIYNSPIPDQVLETGGIDFPDSNDDSTVDDNALRGLYNTDKYYNQKDGWKPLDLTNWLDDVGIYNCNFGSAQNRKEVDVRDKFLKVRIRYSGEDLAIINFLNTIYNISYA